MVFNIDKWMGEGVGAILDKKIILNEWQDMFDLL